MKWVILFVVLVAVAVWAHMSRYQYMSQNMAGLDYIVRIDKLTGTRCFFSGPPRIVDSLQISACRGTNSGSSRSRSYPEGYERVP